MFTKLFFPLALIHWDVGMGLMVSEIKSPPPPPPIYQVVALPIYADTFFFEDAPSLSNTKFPALCEYWDSMPQMRVFHWPFDSLDPPVWPHWFHNFLNACRPCRLGAFFI